ncbi:polycomb protein suz12-like isoform X2 [Liolophura sinensis]|uniref:polycomb protein suz12-like isoform X2 n=1 Tax=Liolophura sinensis TaxID=3198878 RepID=UPI003158B4AA
MRPRKRAKEGHDAAEQQFETVQADHELFLQAFEKPTQIYRYLRTRNAVSPIFLTRNLWYMKHRRSLNNTKRKKFSIDSILEKTEAKQKASQARSECMNILFTGFMDKHAFKTDGDRIDVEACLLKMCHKKRKEVSSPQQTSLGKVQVCVNPSPHNPDLPDPISVGPENFQNNNGHSVKSDVLVIRVSCPVRRSLPNGLCNGDALDSEEPQTKRRRNGRTSPFEEDVLLFGSELVIYDRHKRCQLTDGEYEMALRDLGTKALPKKQATWETVLDGKSVGPFEVFNRGPTLKFTLVWKDVVENEQGVERTSTRNHYNNHCINNSIARDGKGYLRDIPSSRSLNNSHSSPKKRLRIFYQFMYNNNTRQQTEAREDLRCPWCSINSGTLYSLLKHLRLCHSRFTFNYVPHPKGARIDVSINERYDGSYVGNPQDLHSHVGYAFSRNGPVRRTPVTHVIVYRPKRHEPYLAEFLEPESENRPSRQLLQGHNRLYFHTSTCQPIKPWEIDYDSENEEDPEWLRQKTINMIDDFSDVNEGEKELMKLWNVHVMKHNYISDCQLPVACKEFVAEHGPSIIQRKLCKNFLLHLVNLFDFSLIRPEVVHRTYAMLQNLREEMGVDE